MCSKTVSICFGRLLVAILRVRKTTIEQDGSPWALEQERIVSQRRASQASTVSRVFLPPLHTNFSGLSAPFVTTVGRSSSSLHHSNSSHDVLPFTSSNVPDVSYSPRPSLGDVESVRDFRSPTPGSTHGLLASLRQTVSGISSPASTYSQTPKANRQAPHCSTPTSDHEILTFEELPRPSIGSFASASTYMTGNLVGSPAMQKAIVKEVWGTSTPPGTGHSPKVELSRKEARGALVRIGGHLFAGILTYVCLSILILLSRTLAEPSASCFAGARCSLPLPSTLRSRVCTSSHHGNSSGSWSEPTWSRPRAAMRPVGGFVVSRGATSRPYFVLGGGSRATREGGAGGDGGATHESGFDVHEESCDPSWHPA